MTTRGIETLVRFVWRTNDLFGGENIARHRSGCRCALAGLVAVATIPAVYMVGALGFGPVCVIAFRPGKPVHVG